MAHRTKIPGLCYEENLPFIRKQMKNTNRKQKQKKKS